MFSCEYGTIFKNIFFTEQLRWLLLLQLIQILCIIKYQLMSCSFMYMTSYICLWLSWEIISFFTHYFQNHCHCQFDYYLKSLIRKKGDCYPYQTKGNTVKKLVGCMWHRYQKSEISELGMRKSVVLEHTRTQIPAECKKKIKLMKQYKKVQFGKKPQNSWYAA